MAAALARIQAPDARRSASSSDVLYPAYQQRDLAVAAAATTAVDARYAEIDSPHGHDAFLLEHDQVGHARSRPFLDRSETS